MGKNLNKINEHHGRSGVSGRPLRLVHVLFTLVYMVYKTRTYYRIIFYRKESFGQTDVLVD